MGIGVERGGCLHAVAGAGFVILLEDFASAGTGLGTGSSAAFVNGGALDAPVKDVVVLVTFTNEKVTEELAEVRVVRLVIEPQSTGVVEEDAELIGEAAAEQVGGGGHLLLHDAIVLLLLGGSLESLPRERATKEVHEDVSKGLEIIAASLLDTQMGVDGGVASGTGEVLVLPVGDVEMSLRVPVLFGETEIDDVDLVATLADTHEEVIGLDVTMYKIAGMNVLDAGDLEYGTD